MSSFVSATRYYLDRYLQGIPFSGRVIDMGGRRGNTRGSFRPPLDRVACWEFVNKDPSAKPDYLCGVEAVPVKDGGYDWVVFTEVLEYVDDPRAALKECARVLKPGGEIVASIPFLYPVHPDPFDLQRWTPEKLRREFEGAGLRIKELLPRGGIVAVILDLINFYHDAPRLTFGMKLFRVIFVRVAPFFLWFDRGTRYKESLTTGYLIRAVKP
ncbi:MAG: methyltransferase domain-containing protein [Candidatus Omnitrophota bacterium]